jgi:Uma2 family endonuclease
MSELITPPYADRQLFSLHEEDEAGGAEGAYWGPGPGEVTPHRRQVVYLETNFQVELPDRFVGANMGVYWVPSQHEEPWAGPDVFVAARPPIRDPLPRVWLVWEDGPLQFVAEVASEKTRRLERPGTHGRPRGAGRQRADTEGCREEKYQDALGVPECLYVDLDRHQLELWRLQAGKYRRVREEGGRLYSEELGVWFGWDPGAEFVRIWTVDGRILPTPEEWEQQLQEEQRLRQEAEARAAALAAELERLRGGA